MILTDREITNALDCGQLVIKPRPPKDALSSTSIDLTLSRTFAEWPVASGLIIRPGQAGYKYKDVAKIQKQIRADDYTLKPSLFVLGWTAERLRIPVDSQLAARVACT